MSKKVFLLLALVLITFSKLNIVEATGDSTYTVTFVDWNGEVKWVDEVSHGSSAYYHIPVRIGYEFVEWSGSITNVTEDRVVTAIYTPKKYQIDFITLDGSVIVSATLSRDYEIEVLNESTELMFNVGWTPTDEEFTEFVEEVELFQRVFLGDNIIRHVVRTNYGTQVDEYPIEVEGYEVIGWDGDLLVQGAGTITALFQQETDDNVVVNPEDPEEEIIDFTLNDLTLEINELLDASVDETFLISVIDSLVNFLEEDVLEFPELDPGDADGVAISIPKGALVYAEDQGIDLMFMSQGYEIVIPSESLSNILDSIINEFVLEIRNPSSIIKASYELGEFVGTPFEAVEINLRGTATPVLDFEIEVYIDTDHELVVANGDEYTLLSTTEVTGGRRATLQNNGIIIKSVLTEKEDETPPPVIPEPEERFDAIQWLKDLDTSWIILGGLGSYLVIYLFIYGIETYRERN